MESPARALTTAMFLPLLAGAFVCSVIGSFVMWQARVIVASGKRHVPFDLHVLHDEDGSTRHAVLACALGLMVLALPVSLLVQTS